jgi:hypothetical protein
VGVEVTTESTVKDIPSIIMGGGVVSRQEVWTRRQVDLVREVDLVPFIVILGSLAEASINSKNKFFRLGTMVKRWLMRLFRIRRVLSKMMRWGWLRHRGVLMLVQTRVKNQSRKWKKPLNPRKIRYPIPLSAIDASLLIMLLRIVEGGGSRIGMIMGIMG